SSTILNSDLRLHTFNTNYLFCILTFFPMNIICVGCQMRLIYNPMQYEFLQHQQHWNVLITYSALLLGVSQIPFVINFFWSLFAGRKAPANPWNANTLEWTAPSRSEEHTSELQSPDHLVCSLLL